MKHLLIFVENYVAGGTDKMARIYAENLDAEKITILYNNNDDTSILLQSPIPTNIIPTPYSIPTLANLGTFATRYRRILPLFISLKIFNLLIRYPLWIFSLFYFFFRFLKINPTHFIINNGGYPGGEWCRVATISAKLYMFFSQAPTTILHIVHNRATKPFFFLFAPMEYFIDLLIDKSSKLICVSHENAKTLKELRFIKQKIEVIYTGVKINPLKEYPPLDNRPLKLLNVASLYSIKNQLCILQALSNLKSYDIELHLVGAEGEDGYQNTLQQYAQDNNLKVFFHGFCSPEKFYQECDIFVLSSTWEGGPIVTLEAMSYGMPCIMTKVGAYNQQVIDEYNGLIVQNSHKNISKSIEFFIKYPSKIEEMGKNAHRHMQKHFDFDKMIEKYKKTLLDKP